MSSETVNDQNKNNPPAQAGKPASKRKASSPAPEAKTQARAGKPASKASRSANAKPAAPTFARRRVWPD